MPDKINIDLAKTWQEFKQDCKELLAILLPAYVDVAINTWRLVKRVLR